MFLQIGAMGRSAQPALVEAAGFPYVSASDVKHADRPGIPRPLTHSEMKEYIQFFVHSATVAVAGRVPISRLWHAVPCFPTISEVWLRLLEAYRDGTED